MSNLKYKPKNDTVGVPGKGFITAKSFTQKDLNALIERAKNRKQDVHSFLIGCGLVPVNAPELFVESVQQVEEVEPKKRTRRTKAEMQAAE